MKISQEIIEYYKKKGVDMESLEIMLLSEESLKEDWLSPEDNEAWKDL